MILSCGLEFFFGDFSREVFFIFKSQSESDVFFKLITKQNLPVLLTPHSTVVPKQVIALLNWTDLWQRRVLSNFEYLMRLNILAGRSFNDIGQVISF